jgi:hypothetical protein
MVFNFSQLIKFRYRDSSCYQDTVSRAAGLRSAGTSFCRVIYIVLPGPKSFRPLTGIRPSTGIIPSGSFTVTQDSEPSTGIIPSRQLCLDTETFSYLPGLLSGPKACIRLPGFCKNLFQRVPQSATKLNRRAVRWHSSRN